MTRENKIKLAIEKGITCDPKLGIVYGIRGNPITKKCKFGYISFSVGDNDIRYYIRAHQFIFYWVNKKCVDVIDHINRDKSDNRIENLREVTQSTNLENRDCKGYNYDKIRNKWRARIKVNKKEIFLGRFDTEYEARQAYLDAKKIYHNI
jgi:hypothetical protein